MFWPEYVEGLIADHQSGTRDNAYRLWALIQLELWLRTFVDTTINRPVALSVV